MSHDTPSRPLLLPQNRRLRHLQGICLRNLTFTRPRGHTIDDAALNKSPAKLKALRESLQDSNLQSQSTDNLTKLARPAKLRRRSTNWAAQDSAVRQKKLEDVIDSGTSDTFFSLHCQVEDEPLYVSEMIERAMNPTFQSFDLSKHGPTIRRQSSITIKVWAKRQAWRLFMVETIDLAALQFVGSVSSLHIGMMLSDIHSCRINHSHRIVFYCVSLMATMPWVSILTTRLQSQAHHFQHHPTVL